MVHHILVLSKSEVKNLKFGDILRDLLDEHDLSQKQLADDLHISSSAIGTMSEIIGSQTTTL